MKIFLVGIVFIFGIAKSQTVQDLNAVSIYSNDFNSGTSRYLGMGGSMGALGGDISSVEQNPAGLAVAITSEATVTLGFSNFKNEAKFGNKFETNDNSFSVPNFGGTFIFNTNAGAWNRFSIGVNYSQETIDNYIRLGRNENIATSITDSLGTTNYIMNGYQDETLGYKSKLSLNLAASYNDKLYIGLGLNLHEVQYDNYVFFDEDTDGTVYRYDLNGTPYSSNAAGFSFSAGAIGKIHDNFRLGLAYHSPVWYNWIDENYYADLQDFYGYDLYYSNYDRVGNGRIVASAGLVLGKSVALNADYTLHLNGDTELKPSNDFSITNAFFDDYLKSSSEIRVGGEFRVNKFRVRAGYNYVQSPFKEITLNADFGTGTSSTQNFSDAFRGDTNRFSLGAGYDFGGFYLDTAYQYQTQTYNYVFGNGDYVDYDASANYVYYAAIPMNTTNNYVSEVKNKRGLLTFTVGWKF